MFSSLKSRLVVQPVHDFAATVTFLQIFLPQRVILFIYKKREVVKFLSILYTILEFIGNSQSLLTKQHQILRNQDSPSRILDRETTPVMKILKCAS
jgi:hypothetical protein